MKKFLIGIILLCVSTIPVLVLTILVLPFSFIYHLVTLNFFIGLRKFGTHLYEISLSFDKLGNVSLAPVTNLIMVKRKEAYHRFGDKDDSLSYVVAMNNRMETLSKFGLFWVWLLDTIDRGHMNKAIENKILHDKEALERLEARGLI